MARDIEYHEAVIQYNEESARFFSGLSRRTKHPTVARWCRGIAKQHRDFVKKHKSELEKLRAKVVVTEEQSAPIVEDSNFTEKFKTAEEEWTAKDILAEQVEFASNMEAGVETSNNSTNEEQE